ncbi:cytochrome b [Zavarzinia compransoris]|uniref:Cytochrome B n=1 Tax=Zavarzinia compransoris TaxID=1264899 RepID=A0A317E1L3_9PROT|nr:cytochrome b [Zavarzinia compransoris]PWR20030.1 cytochrome B [Zavarzinia compransoris]TDP44850.1 cytochrome b561 [Zavarzinia compransoris]
MAIRPERYSSVAIILHWVMAVAFVLMLASGFVMAYGDLSQSLKFRMFQWHKSLGVLLLLAFVLRLGWRLFHRPPAFPASVTGLALAAAKGGHLALYALMILLPLSGWVMVSASVYGLPTIVFGWFEWPHLPGLAGDEGASDGAKTAHLVLALLFAATIAGHVLAVIKHYLFDRENFMARIWWTR